MLANKSYNLKIFLFFLMCLVLGVTFRLGLLQRTQTLSNLQNVFEMLRRYVDVSSPNTCHNVPKQFGRGCAVPNVSFSNEKSCFFFSSSKQTLEHLVNMDAQMESRLNSCTELSTIRENKEYLVNQFGNRSKPCPRFVTLGYYMGRMGNQMFQIASLVGTAYAHDVIPIIPISIPLKRYFELPNMINLKSNIMSSVVKCVCRKSAAFYNCTKEFNSKTNVSLHGYLQSWKYFEGAKDLIKTVFKFKTKHLRHAKTFLSNVSIAGFQRVCIHIRRGDTTTIGKVAEGYTNVGIDFIEKAKQFYINRYSRVQFLVVSDDKAWCSKHLKDVYISPLTDPGDEMALMALSDHVVVTVGTFGWWGAWLSGGTTVYFNGFPRPGSPLASRMITEDYYPPSWIGIS